MKPVLVKLEPLNIGTVIVSDIIDSNGRLLLKSPAILDENLKDLLENRGIRDVFIEDRREMVRSGSDQTAKNEMQSLQKRLSLLSAENPPESGVRTLLIETIERFYMGNQ